MGIFIKFECDTCGEYECDCPLEKRNIHKPPGYEPIQYNTPQYRNCIPVSTGDIVTTTIVDGKPIDRLYVYAINGNGHALVENIKTHERFELRKPYHKISSVIGSNE